MCVGVGQVQAGGFIDLGRGRAGFLGSSGTCVDEVHETVHWQHGTRVDGYHVLVIKATTTSKHISFTQLK